MDLRQIEYIERIAEEQSITKAAEKLFLSQSALNQQLLNLERELGVALFRRDRRSWEVTEAGEIYLEAGRQILAIQRDAYARISDVAQNRRGELCVGVTPGKGGSMLAHVYKHFHAAYPDIRLQVQQGGSRQIEKELAAGTLDLAVITVDGRRELGPELEALRTVEMVLILSDQNPLARMAYREPDGTLVQDLRAFRDESFALGERGSNNAVTLARLFESAGFSPKICYEGGSFPLRVAMVEANQCCSLIEAHYKNELPDSVLAFSLSAHPTFRWVAAFPKGRHLSRPARAFVELAKEYWENYPL